jgi:hypothetical protein
MSPVYRRHTIPLNYVSQLKSTGDMQILYYVSQLNSTGDTQKLFNYVSQLKSTGDIHTLYYVSQLESTGDTSIGGRNSKDLYVCCRLQLGEVTKGFVCLLLTSVGTNNYRFVCLLYISVGKRN